MIDRENPLIRGTPPFDPADQIPHNTSREDTLMTKPTMAELEKKVLELEEENRRLRDQEALRESEAKFRDLFDLSPQATCLINVEIGVLVDANDEFCKFSGFKKQELLERSMTALGLCSEEEWQGILEDLMKSPRISARETIIKQKSGEERTVHFFARLIHHAGGPFVLAALYDTTEKMQLEAQLLRAQKMEAIGNLAGGIAHDFNNLLMAIQGNTSVMLFNVKQGHPHYQMLKNIEKQVQSGIGLTRQLLGYARKGQYEVLPLDFNGLLGESTESFGRARKGIRIHANFSDDLYAVEADQGQLEQIFLNLFINAADAMAGGGELFIETHNATHLDMKNSPYLPKPGNYIRLIVRDTGTGMDEKTLKHLFDPFFTTKEMGRGTGLGLASVYGIVKSHGGYIDVESKKGKGTTFSLYFPASSKKIAAGRAVPRVPVEGSGTILLVDDEDRVLHITAKLIQKLGYQVIEARGGKEAVELYRENAGQIDIVILDMVMPDMNGAVTFDALKKLDPNVRVLLSSGYSIEGEAEEILKRGCDGFIQKPFTSQAISQKINELLGPK